MAHSPVTLNSAVSGVAVVLASLSPRRHVEAGTIGAGARIHLHVSKETHTEKKKKEAYAVCWRSSWAAAAAKAAKKRAEMMVNFMVAIWIVDGVLEQKPTKRGPERSLLYLFSSYSLPHLYQSRRSQVSRSCVVDYVVNITKTPDPA